MTPAFAPNVGTKVAENLVNVLSDTYVLAIKTHAYHWNMTDKLFPKTHAMFGKQYGELLTAAIGITERIRELDIVALGRIAGFLGEKAMMDTACAAEDPKDVIKDLLASHEVLRNRLAEVCDIADEAHDGNSEDLLVERMLYHDEVIGILRKAVA